MDAMRSGVNLLERLVHKLHASLCTDCELSNMYLRDTVQCFANARNHPDPDRVRFWREEAERFAGIAEEYARGERPGRPKV
jgi:hypothetical protein